MLKLTVGDQEFYNEETEEFEERGGVELLLEHSLLSLSKWESIHEVSFFGSKEKTGDELLSYIRMMVISPEDPGNVFDYFTSKDFERVNEYISRANTATVFPNKQERSPGPKDVITSELIYYWLVAYQIPFEVETWNLNRLFTLIRICNAKNQKPKKMSKAELARRNKELNDRRKAELGTRG